MCIFSCHLMLVGNGFFEKNECPTSSVLSIGASFTAILLKVVTFDWIIQEGGASHFIAIIYHAMFVLAFI